MLRRTPADKTENYLANDQRAVFGELGGYEYDLCAPLGGVGSGARGGYTAHHQHAGRKTTLANQIYEEDLR